MRSGSRKSNLDLAQSNMLYCRFILSLAWNALSSDCLSDLLYPAQPPLSARLCGLLPNGCSVIGILQVRIPHAHQAADSPQDALRSCIWTTCIPANLILMLDDVLLQHLEQQLSLSEGRPPP